MTYVFQASGLGFRQDFPTGKAAADFVEAQGSGNVVQFMRERNLPHCLPEFVLRSLSLWRYDGGMWSRFGIFSPSAEFIDNTRPGFDEECGACAAHYGDGGPCDQGKPVNSPHRSR